MTTKLPEAELTTETKQTNPKDVIGSSKLAMSLVPSTVMVYAALAFLEGALKYGRFNWRISGVRFSIYLDAIHRHLAKIENCEWEDPVTGVPHLSSIIACAGIIADAALCNKLIDDRAPSAPVGSLIDSMPEKVAKLNSLFADHAPHQYTISDSIGDPIGDQI